MYRSDDLKAFVLVDGYYYLEDSILAFPDNLHHRYEYKTLKRLGFLETKELPEKTRDEHIVEFLVSFHYAIQEAGGNVNSFGPKTTLLEMASSLAQNGIRFTYEGKN
jgi:hypothetical protein